MGYLPNRLTFSWDRSRVRTAELNWKKGCSTPYDIEQKEFLRGWVFISLSSTAQGASWASAVSMCITCYIHTSIYTYVHIYMLITIILFLFSLLVNSFLSIHEFLFFFLFFFLIPSPHPTGKGGSEWYQLTGTQPPATLNHNTDSTHKESGFPYNQTKPLLLQFMTTVLSSLTMHHCEGSSPVSLVILTGQY